MADNEVRIHTNRHHNLNNGSNIFTDPTIKPIDHSADNQINQLQLDLSGADANDVTLSTSANTPSIFKLVHVGLNWTLELTGGGNPTNAEWAFALSTITATSTAPTGTFKVSVDALDSGLNPISNSVTNHVTCCFMAGTLIASPQGPAQVESLKTGDFVTTTDGRAAAIRWVGRQTISRIFADPMRVLPIRVKANALEDNVPSRDLLISPDHALLVDGVLIQAGALVNGTSIVRERNTPQVFVYYHVELADHSLILAENAPAETFIDNVDRLAFDNWNEHEALYGESAPIVEMKYPRAKAARQVPQASRVRLAVRGSNLYSEERADVA